MKLWIAVATLIGTIVGAGILGIPYVITKAGLLAGVIDLIAIGLLLMLLNLYLGEVTLRTKGNHQITGYAEKYLGKTGKIIIMLSMMIQIYGAMTAYTIGEGTTFSSLFGGSPVFYAIIFFAVGSLLIYKGLKTVGKTELILVSCLALSIIVISLISLPSIEAFNFEGGTGNFFLPYGVIIFAYMGLTSIPLLKEQLSKNRKQLKKAIILGSLIPIGIYLLFSLTVMGIIGIEGFEQLPLDERIASVALSYFVHPIIGVFINLFAILSMGTSFLALGIALQKMYEYDFKIHKFLAWILTISVPFFIYILDLMYELTDFFQILGITGAITGGLTAILVMGMFHKARIKGDKNPEWKIGGHWLLSLAMMFLFVLGIIFQLLFQ